MTDQIRISDSGELEIQPLSKRDRLRAYMNGETDVQPTTWDGEPLYSPASVAEGLFDADAFSQMRGQMALEADDAR